MGSTIYEVLDELRATALSEADKGTRFERLITAYLRVDPVFADQFSDVWLWGEYPDNGGKHDTGIDLVARDRNTGHDVAIQCKFFAPTTTIAKPMIDSFLAASGKASFAERIIETRRRSPTAPPRPGRDRPGRRGIRRAGAS